MIRKHNGHRLAGCYSGISEAVCETIHTGPQGAERHWSVLMHGEDEVGRVFHPVFQQPAYRPLVSHVELISQCVSVHRFKVDVNPACRAEALEAKAGTPRMKLRESDIYFSIKRATSAILAASAWPLRHGRSGMAAPAASGGAEP
jgi:hypothetical protein